MNSKNPKASVIILTYNHAQTLGACLDSVLAQETDFPFEVIVTDDASPSDNTQEIIRQYAEAYPDIIKPILRQKNVGVLRNNSEAYNSAQGEYIANVEGDDKWCHKGKLQLAIDVLDNNPDCILFTHNTMVHDHSRDIEVPLVSQEWAETLGEDHKFTYKNNAYTHFSARVHRKIEDIPVQWEVFAYHYLLSQGNGYYHDEIMSVYNYGDGMWGQMNLQKQRKMDQEILADLNHYREVDLGLKENYAPYFTTCYGEERAKALEFAQNNIPAEEYVRKVFNSMKFQ